MLPILRLCAWPLGVTAFAIGASRAIAQSPAPTPPAITTFNRAFADATRDMDNAATMALWADDGVSLLPNQPPVVGKPAIAAFIDKVTRSITGAHMVSFTLDCHDTEVSASGDLATEWCTEHQVVAIPGKPNFDGWGKMLLVLRRESNGRGDVWRLTREMWNPAAPPTAPPR